MIDLHMHSTFSDGSLKPAQLVEEGARIRLKGMALTDHDSTAGVPQFMAACAAQGVVGIPGVEISAEIAKGTMHVLGYHVDRDCRELEGVLEQIRDGRESRNRKILGKLCAAGLELTWDEVAAFAGEDVVGRPHFAQALLAKGYVSSKDAAFELYLAKGRPAYVDRFRLPPRESIATILAAGGVPVLSHPFTLDLSQKALKDTVTELKSYGLAGLEVYYSEHTPEMTKQYLSLCASLGLVATGGSDFHGDVNPKVSMGTGFGQLCVPDDVLENLQRVKDEVSARKRG